MSVEDVRRAVWLARIPLKVHLAREEITTTPGPVPYYMLAPRHSYLPLLVTELKEYFDHVLPPGEDQPWFDYRGLPLKWNLSIGALYDLLADEQTPWAITVHFRDFPSDVLLRCDEEETARSGFMNSLKEATYIATGSTRTIMGLTTNELDSLWDSVRAVCFQTPPLAPHGTSSSTISYSNCLVVGMCKAGY